MTGTALLHAASETRPSMTSAPLTGTAVISKLCAVEGRDSLGSRKLLESFIVHALTCVRDGGRDQERAE